MPTIRELMKAEYAKMPSANLQGVLAQGQTEIAAWMKELAQQQGLAPDIIEQMEESRAEDAREMMADITEELRRRGVR